jgi:hypothetical protein
MIASSSIVFWFARKIAKKKEKNTSFVMSVRMSVHMEQLSSHWTDFHEVWCFRIFRKSVEKIEISLKSDKNNAYFTKAVEDIKTLILYSINFSENRGVYVNVDKYGKARQTTNDNKTQSREDWICMPDTDTHF